MVSSFESRKAILRARRDQVVANRGLVLQELITHLYADRVLPNIRRSCVALAIAIEASYWIRAAGLQDRSENILDHYLRLPPTGGGAFRVPDWRAEVPSIAQ